MKNNWKKCKIGDIGTVVGGSTPSTKDEANYNEGNISWITPKDLSNFNERYIFNGSRNITDKGLKNCSAQLMPKNSVLFTSRAPIGYVAIAGKELCTNQGFKSVIPNKDTDYMFLYYLLKFNKEYIESMGSGTTFKEVSGTTMKNIEVSVPPLTTQRQIAKILSSLDDKIELNNRINKNLEEQAMAIYKSWFVDFEPFGGKMPKDWRKGIVDDIASDIICGKTPSTKNSEYYGTDIPFITIPDMHNNVYVINTERSLSFMGANTQPQKTLPQNSVCISCIGTAGLVSLVAFDSQTNQQINAIIPKDGYSPFYIFLVMKTLSKIINKLGSSGSTITNLNKEQFRKIEVVVPSLPVMKNFHSLVSAIFKMIYSNQVENLKLTSMRDALLPKLMNGEVDVSKIKV